MAGMVQYCDFETQVSSQGTNSKQRPDLVIHLYNDRMIVVDAKVPMEAYLDAAAAKDDAARATKLRLHAQRVRAHIRDLANKEYWRLYQPTPEIVVLFLPNEATFRAALEQDPTLIDLSIQQNVLLASPLTLIALLKTVAYGWSQENRARSIQQIVNQSQTLHEELVKFADQGNKFRSRLDETVGEFNQLANAYNTKVLPVIKQLRALDSTLPNKDKVLQVSPLSRKLEEFVYEEAEPVRANQDVEVPFITLDS
jgi:DNA recombination protein RmuC